MKVKIRRGRCPHRPNKKIKSIEPLCTKNKPCLLCQWLGVKKDKTNLQCKFCNMKNKFIVRWV